MIAGGQDLNILIQTCILFNVRGKLMVCSICILLFIKDVSFVIIPVDVVRIDILRDEEDGDGG